MARWKLTAPHYLNVPGTEFEYKEVSRETGKQAIKKFPVPLLLNPEDPGDNNYPGETIVCHAGKGQREANQIIRNTDLVFAGPPTPEMEPLDDEARKISDNLRPGWSHPIESLPGTFDQSLINRFEREMQTLSEAQTQAVTKDELAELKAQIAALTKKLADQPMRR